MSFLHTTPIFESNITDPNTKEIIARSQRPRWECIHQVMSD